MSKRELQEEELERAIRPWEELGKVNSRWKYSVSVDCARPRRTTDAFVVRKASQAGP